MPTFDTDVLVIGAGPAGLTAAALLAEYGTSAITVTKYPGTAHSPRAHITNQRTMEVFRDLGMEDDVREAAVPNELMGNNVWATSFAGRELARLMSWGSGVARKADYEAASPTAMCNIPQHILEPLILRAGQRRDADIRFSTELISIDQTPDAVHATVRDTTSGREYGIRARYAIGADGGRSTVAQQTGFPFDGESGLGHAANVWFEADLTRYTAHRPGTLYWMSQPGNDYWVGSGTFICVKPWTEWVMLFMYDPDEGEPDLSDTAVSARAAELIGDPGIDIRIKSVSKWQINHMVARTYRKGRIFLAGDAAHRHPPANGLGTNTSVQDVHNLAWKLSWVLRGHAGEALLDTYDAERQPVGKQVVDRAMKSVQDMLPISQAFGFRPGQSAEEGWRGLDELLSDTEAGRQSRTSLREAVSLQNYQFNAHGVELGQRYSSTAIVPDGTPPPPYDRDPELYYHHTTRPGARLPHTWLQKDNQQLSTLDLAGHGRFTVLTGIGGQAWLDAAEKIGAELGIEIAGRLLGPGRDYADVLGDWDRAKEITDRGCLLVRPDHHIAWRSNDLPTDPADALRRVFTQVLAH
ncbi:FAD-dependent monooxygenase [Streptomyces sp. NBC_00243]|uniref:FAD-dependent monooxygenase n=1 Tax=Streptomyces sp. NBC_00243 TaxID=2975688 RepID=UPI002DDB33D5|nr:FAD-dependent monooxygenase [Streptomyces sp. NBC_00243]WRZ18907.1 FAD-dependent monooxygenase [Streptomyces sp. NBC_00243]